MIFKDRLSLNTKLKLVIFHHGVNMVMLQL